MTRNEAIAANIAKRIAANTRKRFSTLYADALEELNMPIQHPKTDAQLAEQKRNEQAALLNRIAELEKRVAALEGKQ